MLSFLSSNGKNSRKGLWLAQVGSSVHPQSWESMIDSLQLVPNLVKTASQEPHVFRKRWRMCLWIDIHLGLYILETNLPGPTDGRQWLLGTTESLFLEIHLKILPSPSGAPERSKHRKWMHKGFLASCLLLKPLFQAALLAVGRQEGTESWQCPTWGVRG